MPLIDEINPYNNIDGTSTPLESNSCNCVNCIDDDNCDRSQKERKGGSNFRRSMETCYQRYKVNPGHYKAKRFHCKKFWPRENNITYTRNSQLPTQINNHYDELLLKTWIVTDIPFEVIETPFIKNLFKTLVPAYVLSSRTTLSG
ncbi:2459_t:CDS:2 [Ambispora leptoticha]|uniref:2459_t:CDS:1 n=1 Tax=Ambispora leptoticha TaxID=144679 RepID=A0A9N8WR34_9GLOM|nr:2459_t:CDS:2 [Ambispora leptoticha]